jgi:hypothetical protein
MSIKSVHIDDVHIRAICDEVGDRLRAILRREITELPPHLQSLVDRLTELDQETPSIAPSLEDMVSQKTLVMPCWEDVSN